MTTIILVIAFSSIFGCTKEIDPIDYGKDQCSHCKMTIVDNKYGAEIVSGTGKAFKFDAAECLINHMISNKTDSKTLDKILVTDLTEPGKFIDAESAVFLISPKLRSPMGENISSFPDNVKAEKYKSEYGGETFDWNGIVNLLSNR